MLRPLFALSLLAFAGCQATAPKRTELPVKPESAAERDQRILREFGEHCRFERACGALWGIDCDAAMDGPYYYVDPATLDVVSACGGHCMGGRCVSCPPPGWTCPTY